MQRSDPDKPEPPLEARLRAMRIIWAALFLAVGLYALVGYVVGPMTGAELDAATGKLNGHVPPGQRSFLLPLLVILGVVAVLASIVVRRAYARRAEAGRRPELLQTGLIIAVVLCEVAALAGLVGLFVTGDSYAYVLFLVSAAGIALHFPRREQLLAASHKTFGQTGRGGFGR